MSESNSISQKVHDTQSEYVRLVEALRGGAAARISWDEIYKAIDHFTEGFPVFAVPFNSTNKVGRGRNLHALSNSEDSKSLVMRLDDIKYSKPEHCNAYGRCNRPKEPICYAGIGTNVILSELAPEIGDYVALLHFTTRQEIYLKGLGYLDFYFRNGGQGEGWTEGMKEVAASYTTADKIHFRVLDAFFADMFSKPFSNEIYKITSAISAAFLEKSPLSGLVYNSVANRGGRCIALKTNHFDKYVVPTEAQILRITSNLGYGIYDFVEEYYADSFEDEKILWRKR
jgi:hypothetical protein